MADKSQFDLLMTLIGRPAGRRQWNDYKQYADYIDFSSADFSEMDLSGIDLSGLDLSGAVFIDCNLTDTNLSKSNLRRANLRRARMTRAKMHEANLSQVNLEEADLTDAAMTGANLGDARMRGVNMLGADLTAADLRFADLRDASLKYACLDDAFVDEMDVTNAQLTGVLLGPRTMENVKNFGSVRLAPPPYRNTPPHIYTHVPISLSQGDPLDELLADDDRKSAMRSAAEKFGGLARKFPSADRRAKADRRRKQVKFTGPDRRDGEERRDESGEEPALEFTSSDVDLTTIEGCCIVLGIEEDSDEQTIVKAFRKKAKLYHPDMVGHLSPRMQELAGEEFRRLHTAYETLTHRTTRSLKGIVWPPGVPKRASAYDYTTAEYRAMAKLNPSNLNIFYNLAWKYFDDGNLKKAQQGFTYILMQNPADDDAAHNLMIVNMFMEAKRERQEREQLEGARAW